MLSGQLVLTFCRFLSKSSARPPYTSMYIWFPHTWAFKVWTIVWTILRIIYSWLLYYLAIHLLTTFWYFATHKALLFRKQLPFKELRDADWLWNILTPRKRYSCFSSVTFLTPPITREKLVKNVCVFVSVCVCVSVLAKNGQKCPKCAGMAESGKTWPKLVKMTGVGKRWPKLAIMVEIGKNGWNWPKWQKLVKISKVGKNGQN